MTNKNNNLLEIKNLCTYFGRGKKLVRAVDGVSFSIPRGSTLGLVGESGSGKTTVGRTILRLIPYTSGDVFINGMEIFKLPSWPLKPLRSFRKKAQMIFQDPASSLNPRMTVGGIISEPLKVHFPEHDRKWRQYRAAQLLERVGLSPEYINRYPHEFSGGQRQRIGIARALASEPEFIICDEPVSALDVSIQAQILNLLKDLQEDLGLTYLFIAHNLAVVEHFADNIAVMNRGKIVEQATCDELYANPQHEYTRKLLAAVPSCDPEKPNLSAR